MVDLFLEKNIAVYIHGSRSVSGIATEPQQR